MPEYQIERWDSVIPEGATFPFPMIYIKADKAFIDLAKKSNYTVLVAIKNSGSLYDKTPLVGVIDSSGLFPTPRPNFFNQTQLYTVTLSADWLGYPPNLGKAVFEGEEEAAKTMQPVPFVAPKPVPWTEWYGRETGEAVRNMTRTSRITYIVIIALVILLIIVFQLR